MSRYIDADKLIQHLEDEIKGCEPPFGGRANGKSIAYGTMLGLKSVISFADTLPTADVVEVVRCKDCKHCDHCYPMKNKGEEAKEEYYCDYNKRYVKPNDYCSYGERREE